MKSKGSFLLSILTGAWVSLYISCQSPTPTYAIIQAGKPIHVALVGDHWQSVNGAWVSSGIGNEAYIDQYVEDADFSLHMRLSLDSLNKSTALALIFGNHFGFDSNTPDPKDQHRLFFYSPALGEVKFFGKAREYFQPGEPFSFSLLRKSDSLTIQVNEQIITVLPISDLAGPLTGRIGIRPWRNTLRIYDWAFSGELTPPDTLTYVYETGKEGYDRYAIPAIVETNTQTLLAFAEGRGGKWYNDMGDIDILVKRSNDGGETWSPLQVILDDGPHSCQNPVPIVDQPRGRIVLVSTRKAAQDIYRKVLAGTASERIQVWVCHSDDDGKTWSAPREITDEVQPDSMLWYATGPGSGLQIQEGPYAGRMVIASNHTLKGDKRYRAHSIYSDDGGMHWQMGGIVPGVDINEGEVAEGMNGQLVINLRNFNLSHRFRRVAMSEDGGQSWTPVEADTVLLDPCAQGSLLSFTQGELPYMAFANPAHAYFRKNLVLRLSRDGGKTWEKAYQVHPGPAANSDIVKLSSGDIGVLYSGGNFSPVEGVLFRRVPFSDVK